MCVSSPLGASTSTVTSPEIVVEITVSSCGWILSSMQVQQSHCGYNIYLSKKQLLLLYMWPSMSLMCT